MIFSQFPWRRGLGNDCALVFDGQSSIVAQKVGTSDGNLIAAAPELFEYVRSAASSGCATAEALLKKHWLPVPSPKTNGAT